MLDFIKNTIKTKKEYKDQMEKVKMLPDDYRFVFEKISKYIWSFASGDGMDTLKTQYELIELFTITASEGKPVLQVTGDDVIGFCDDFFSDTKKWTDNFKNRLNRDINNKLQ